MLNTAKFKSSFVLLGISAAGSLMFIFRSLERGIRVDWDIDTFITISQSFLGGNHIYIDFFDPKWPHVQWLFLPAAISKSLSIHLFTSWLTLVGTGFAITLIACRAHAESITPQRTQLAGALYIILAPLLPGGSVGHLEVYSNLFMAVGTYLIMISIWRRKIETSYCIAFIGSISIGLSAGIRPNLIIPISLIMLVLYFTRRTLTMKSRWLLVIAGGLTTGLLLPFGTYITSKAKLIAAWYGSIGILEEWNKGMYASSTLSSFASDVVQLLSPRVFGIPFAFLLASLFALILCGIRSQRKSRTAICVLLAAWIAGLYLSYWRSHIHHHYILMDLCGACLFLAFSENYITQSTKRIVLWTTVIIVAGVGFYPMKPASAVDRQAIKAQEKILEYLESNPSLTFSAPEFINLHWRRNQSVSTQGIHPVWSINMLNSSINQSKPAKELGLTTTFDEQCARWLSSKIDLFISRPHLSQKCQRLLGADWEEMSELALRDKDESVQIFRQKKRQP